MNAHRLTLRTLFMLCALVGLLALAGAQAGAAVRHEFLFSFDQAPGGVGEMNSMTEDSGHLWTAEQISGSSSFRVDEFDAATGAFISQPLLAEQGSPEYLAVAVGHLESEPEPELYVAQYGASATVGVYSQSGSPQATWSGAQTGEPFAGVIFGLAVDNSKSGSDWAAGDVYVPDSTNHAVYVFRPETGGKEKYVTKLPDPEPGGVPVQFKEPRDVAVSSLDGDVIVTDENAVDVFEPTGLGEYTFVRQLTGTPTGPFKSVSNVAVDGGNGEIYVVDKEPEEKFAHPPTFIDQFNSAGIYRDRMTGTPAGPFQRVEGTAVDPVSHDLYVDDSRRNETTSIPENILDAFGPSVVVPDVTVSQPANLTPFGSTLRGTVNPDEAGPATCEFEYGTSASYGSFAECAGAGSKATPIPGGAGENSQVAVQSTPVTGLQPDTIYYYRLDASNGGKLTNDGICPEDCGQFTTTGPGIHGESVSDVASTSTTLEATIDPNKARTSYFFQYADVDTGGCKANPSPCTSVPALPATIGEGEGDVEVQPEHVQGLVAGTVYHYRVVVLSELKAGEPEVFYGPDRTFTTQTASPFALPDSRQWELVSPTDKHGALISPLSGGPTELGGPLQAAEDGGAIVYRTSNPTELEPPGYAQFSDSVQVLSRRGAHGWSTTDIATPHSSATYVSLAPEYKIFSSDLSAGLAAPESADGTLLSAQASEPTPYVRREALCDAPATSSECYLPILTGKEGFADVPPGTQFGGSEELRLHGEHVVQFAGASPDLRHIALTSDVALTEVALDGVEQANELYEWSAGVPAGQAVQMVSILPQDEGGGPALTGLFDNTPHEVQVGVGMYATGGSRNAVSSDGSRIFWELGAETQSPASALYMRDMARQETVRLDVSQPGAPTGMSEAKFQFANADGSKVFFTDNLALTSESGMGTNVASNADLYECDIVEEAGKLACKLTDLTPKRSGESAGVQNLIAAASKDGSYVYFVADGVLSENKNGQGEGATPGTCSSNSESADDHCNLYEVHNGTITFIATLSEADQADWGGKVLEFETIGHVVAYASPDGRYLTFSSQRSLTGYGNRDAVTGKPDAEVFLYDTAAGRLACISCNPTGARPTGVEAGELLTSTSGGRSGNVASVNVDVFAGGEQKKLWLAASLPSANILDDNEKALRQPRVLSDSGRMFFNSSDALMPQDVNGNEDVYEFEPEGTGGCAISSMTFNANAGGCVSLISSGAAAEESGFLEASGSGADVFFMTTAKLASQDVDGSYDVYDAHVCSASAPCAPPTVSLPPCDSGDACKGAPSPQLSIFGAAASATFSGAGNVSSSGPNAAVTARRLTRPQKLTRALRACLSKPKKQRAACRRQARKRYGSKPARRASATKGGAK
jgi:hypothetical protein